MHITTPPFFYKSAGVIARVINVIVKVFMEYTRMAKIPQNTFTFSNEAINFSSKKVKPDSLIVLQKKSQAKLPVYLYIDKLDHRGMPVNQ